MSYEKIGFVGGQTLKAEHLNHIEDGFDETLATAKAYSDSKGGYVETRVFINDGNNDDDEYVADDMRYVRVGEIIDLASVTEVDGMFSGVETNISADNMAVEEILGVHCLVFDEFPVVYSIPDGMFDGVSAGMYVFSSNDGQNFVTRVVAETIRTIEPKYLPGVCLPVVELSTVVPVDGNFVVLTAEESAAIDEAVLLGVPFVVKCTGIIDSNSAEFSFVCNIIMGMLNAQLSEKCAFNGQSLVDGWNVKFDITG